MCYTTNNNNNNNNNNIRILHIINLVKYKYKTIEVKLKFCQ